MRGVRAASTVHGVEVASVGRGDGASAADDVVDGRGGALLPGLHDHHIHLFALAAAEGSIACGPPAVECADDLARALRAAADHARRTAGAEAWLRGVGYHESVAGDLDRAALDGWVADLPLRIQHRSGAAWFLNGAAIDRLGLDRGTDAPGVERDAAGRARGRLFRCDRLLRERIAGAAVPSLASVSRRLASFGVTGVTDASAHNGASEAAAFGAAIESGELLQDLYLMGADELEQERCRGFRVLHRKIVLDEAALPELGELVATIAATHERGRAVAIHCVTRAELVLACAALAAAGSRTMDRIEHASIAPPEVVELVKAAAVTVVTQPGFVYERGDRYLTDVEPRDRAWLYRAAGLVRAGVALGAGTDAPFGDPDPWRAIAAAVARRTRDGQTLGDTERLSAESALGAFTSSALAPGAAPRTIAPGEAADLCLLDRPWRDAREQLSSELVRATIRAGRCIWLRD
jgi:predicted amidohydrolase YtcJ